MEDNDKEDMREREEPRRIPAVPRKLSLALAVNELNTEPLFGEELWQTGRRGAVSYTRGSILREFGSGQMTPPLFVPLDERQQEVAQKEGYFGTVYPDVPDPVDPARKLNPKDLLRQRSFFFSIVLSLNLACLMGALFGQQELWVFIFILFVKSKDFLSVNISAFGLLIKSMYRLFRAPKSITSKWILSLIPAYSESETQIIKTIFSLRDNGVEPHNQVMCIMLDGKPRDVVSRMDRIVRNFERPYISLKWKRGMLKIAAGFMEQVPVILIEKIPVSNLTPHC